MLEQVRIATRHQCPPYHDENNLLHPVFWSCLLRQPAVARRSYRVFQKGVLSWSHELLDLEETEAVLVMERAGSAHTTAATTGFRFRDAKFVCKTKEDGSYELDGLCKGKYNVAFKAPPAETIDRTVIVPSNNNVITLIVRHGE